MGTDMAPLPFGIPALDHLMGYSDCSSPDLDHCLRTSTSLTILGQDGTGKSAFALHLASTYRALRHRSLVVSDPMWEDLGPQPLVLYVSSDLKFSAAARMWDNFSLDEPWLRYVPSIPAYDIGFRRAIIDQVYYDLVVKLDPCRPDELAGRIQSLRAHPVPLQPEPRPHFEQSITFVDLSAMSTGDDWLFLTRLASAVPRTPGAPPNLLIVDSVAGLETFVGDRNSFGETMSRRARVAQLVQTAAQDWHTVFVVEEPQPGSHHPEEYVTDTVIHLRRQGGDERARRILEVEKCRGRSFADGEHTFQIRNGKGTSTGSWENPDDQMTFRRPEASADEDRNDFNAYIQVFPSLHYLSKELAGRMTLERKPAAKSNAPFGIRYLDDMLAKEDEDGIRGLPTGSVTSLIGDEGTLKSDLAEQFLRESFAFLPHLLGLMCFAVEEQRKSKKDINVVLKDFPKTHAECIEKHKTEFPHSVARLNDRLTQWLSSYERRRHKLTNVFSDCHRLLREDELNLALCPARQRRPLAPRWDESLYHSLSERNQRETDTVYSLALALMRASSGLLAPVVYISTSDTAADNIADHILKVQRNHLRKVLASHGIDESVYRAPLHRLIERFIIVRRVELADATGPQLWQIINACVTQALTLMGTDPSTLEKRESFPYAGDIRFVLNDLRLIRDTYPSVSADSLFLPTVVFRLRRMGVTALIVDSENGRPDMPLVHTMNGALRSLVDHQIYTWKVPFFGEERVAISVIPPLPGNAAGTIRELKYSSPEDVRQIEVDPNFSLYMGVEEGKPAAVPLEIILYEETPAFAEYIDAEQALFSHAFSPFRVDKPVIRVEKTRDYDGLRDYCHLPTETRLPFTLIFAVDEFWAGSQDSSLRGEGPYLYADLPDQQQKSRYIDSFGLFRDTRQQQKLGQHSANRSARFRQQNGGARCFYDSCLPTKLPTDSSRPPVRLDRIPFTWDFGFLLCNEKQWKNASSVHLPISDGDVKGIWNRLRRSEKRHQRFPAPTQAETRGGPSKAEPGDKRNVSWREFLEACCVVARVEERRTEKRVLPFDLATATPESVSCCLFEIWLSEIAADAVRLRETAKSLGTDNALGQKAAEWSNAAFKDLDMVANGERWSRVGKLYLQDVLCKGKSPSALAYYQGRAHSETGNEAKAGGEAAFASLIIDSPGYSLQLYKTWLLLLEVLDFNKYQDPNRAFELRSDYDPTATSSASRHWYKTACTATASIDAFRNEDGTLSQKTPVRLPGHFSVRGDWFLAVAKGSRSHHLADRALDLLTSRRGNRTRMHLGVGLPTRDILAGPNIELIRTRLFRLTEEGALQEVLYGELLNLGAQWPLSTEDAGNNLREDSGERLGFRWAFRSAFAQYDRQARATQRWIHRMLTWTVRYRNEHRATWKEHSGFAAYDAINGGSLSSGVELGLLEFAQGLDVFIDDLNAASLPDNLRSETVSAHSTAPPVIPEAGGTVAGGAQSAVAVPNADTAGPLGPAFTDCGTYPSYESD
jgi:KaiC/GvpD/RAD55 family RecA-like ATPase